MLDRLCVVAEKWCTFFATAGCAVRAQRVDQLRFLRSVSIIFVCTITKCPFARGLTCACIRTHHGRAGTARRSSSRSPCRCVAWSMNVPRNRHSLIYFPWELCAIPVKFGERAVYVVMRGEVGPCMHPITHAHSCILAYARGRRERGAMGVARICQPGSQ